MDAVIIGTRISDEFRDRAVRWVLWTSLAIAVVPIVAAIALQPRLNQMSLADAGAQLSAEVAFGRTAPADPVRSILKRASSGIVRAVQSLPGDSDALGQGADGFLGRIEQALMASPTACLALRGASTACTPRPEPAPPMPEGDPPLRLIEQPTSRPAPLFPELAHAGAAAPGVRDLGWRRYDAGVYVHERGAASLTIAGAVALDDLSALRPIRDIGVGAYLAGAPELSHGALSGRAVGAIEQEGWRLRPELDVTASYLALEKVRLDAGEAGLFLPETDDWIFSARPSLALEGEVDAGQGITLAPRLRAGATWLSQDEFSIAATMLDAPAAIAGVPAALTPIEETFADIEAGLGIAASDRLQLQLSYGRLYGEAFETQTGRVELSMQF